MNQALSRSLSLYYSEIGRTNPVSDPEEERRLIRLWQTRRDKLAQRQLLDGHLRFVVTMARKRSKDPARLEDLIAAGNLGLVKALDRYDLNRRPPVRLLTYASSWINKEMLDNDYTSSLVHVPTHRQKAQRKQAKAYRAALLKHGHDSAVAKRLNPGLPEGSTVSLDQLRQSIEDRRTPSGLDRSLTSHDHGAMTFVPSDAADSNKALRHAIAELPPREQTVLNLYYGIKDEPRNFAQIASLLEMSSERVRQIKISGMKLLKEMLGQRAVLEPSDAY